MLDLALSVFVVRVESRLCDVSRQVLDDEAAAVDAKPVVVVHREVRPFVERPDHLGDRRAPERRRLADAAVLHQPLEGVVGGGVSAGDAIVGVDVVGVTVDEVTFGMVRGDSATTVAIASGSSTSSELR